MNLVNQSDLQFDYPEPQTGEDDLKLTGEPDSSLFNRDEVWEMLYMLNKFFHGALFAPTESIHKAERLLRNELPGNIRSQANVIVWLNNNFNNKSHFGRFKNPYK